MKKNPTTDEKKRHACAVSATGERRRNMLEHAKGLLRKAFGPKPPQLCSVCKKAEANTWSGNRKLCLICAYEEIS